MAKKNVNGRFLIAIGAMLILAALSLVLYNLNIQKSADEKMSELLEETKSVIPSTYVDYDPKEKERDSLLSDLDNISVPSQETPAAEVREIEIIGFIQIPGLDLELPVTSGWNYDLMSLAACRYSGELLDKNLIICAHNYSGFFQNLDALNSGDMIYFIDVNGVRYTYEVIQSELLSGYAVDTLLDGDDYWDLTLFTCTWSGRSRVTVRAEMV